MKRVFQNFFSFLLCLIVFHSAQAARYEKGTYSNELKAHYLLTCGPIMIFVESGLIVTVEQHDTVDPYLRDFRGAVYAILDDKSYPLREGEDSTYFWGNLTLSLGDSSGYFTKKYPLKDIKAKDFNGATHNCRR